MAPKSETKHYISVTYRGVSYLVAICGSTVLGIIHFETVIPLDSPLGREIANSISLAQFKS